MSDSENLNQTDFSETAPQSDPGEAKPNVFAAPKSAPETTEKPKREVQKPSPLLLGGIFVVVVLAVAVAVMVMPKEQAGTQTQTPASSATPSPSSNLPPELQKSVDTLSTDVKNADPQNNDLPFPPVNFQLHLVQPQAGQ